MASAFNAISRYSEANVEHISFRRLDLQSLLLNDWGAASISPSACWNLTANQNLGSGTVYNTPLAAHLLCTALAMSTHPAIEKGLAALRLRSFREQYDPAVLGQLIEQKVLSGMRILDLGCGIKPVYPRLARAMGAQVWTVDVERLSNLGPYREGHDLEFARLEAQGHIQLNFHQPQAIEKILEHSEGLRFHFIGCAHPMIMDARSNYHEPPARLWQELLEDGGVYNAPGSFQGRWELGFKGSLSMN